MSRIVFTLCCVASLCSFTFASGLTAEAKSVGRLSDLNKDQKRCFVLNEDREEYLCLKAMEAPVVNYPEGGYRGRHITPSSDIFITSQAYGAVEYYDVRSNRPQNIFKVSEEQFKKFNLVYESDCPAVVDYKETAAGEIILDISCE